MGIQVLADSPISEGREHGILLGGMYLSVRKAKAERLEASGIPFACLFDRHGQIVTVPVNDD